MRGDLLNQFVVFAISSVGGMFLLLTLYQHLFGEVVFKSAINGIIAIAFFIFALVIKE